MLKKLLFTLFFQIGFLFNAALATADQVTEVVNDVAAKLVQQLPMDKKIALPVMEMRLWTMCDRSSRGMHIRVPT